MSRTGLDASTLANSLRTMAGDGSLEWVAGPIRASVLLDIVDMLDKTTELRDERERLFRANVEKNGEILRLLDENARLKQELEAVGTAAYLYGRTDLADENAKLRELTAKYSAAAKYLCGHSHCNECNLDCASVFGDVPSGWDCARSLLDKEARELGVEVS